MWISALKEYYGSSGGEKSNLDQNFSFDNELLARIIRSFFSLPGRAYVHYREGRVL
jgi:hypothetical protein